MKLRKYILLFALMTAASWTAVSLDIQIVDTDAGTLDIYMTNQPDCSYCEDPTYNNISFLWTDQKEHCETNESTWIVDTGMTQAECAAIPSINELGGWWFDGNVKGFQFELLGMTLTGISGGFADEYLDYVSYSAATGVILGASFGSGAIPVGEGVLTQVSFSDYEGDNICFGTSTADNVFSDASGGAIWIDWGTCFCSEDNPADECGICDGDGIPEGECDCNGNEEDECGVCNGDNTSCADCEGAPNGDAVIDACGNCGGDGIADDACDCAGNVEDCTGECDGSAVEDECGVCGGSGIDEGTCDCAGNVEDCAGECGGSGEVDECGECNGDGIDEGACDCAGNVEDCTGECGGSAVEDECGECNGDGIDEGTCDCAGNVEDCAGECGGSGEVDECGECNGDGIDEGACDCAGQEVDICGICGGSGPIANFDCAGNCLLLEGCNDCFGIVNGTGQIDECNQCIDCSQQETFIDENNDGEYNDGETFNDVNNNGMFDGCEEHDAWNESCTDCFDDLNGSAYLDACNVCVGGDTGQYACLFDCDNNLIWDSSESGPFITDNCDECDNIFYNDCEVDCNGDWGGTATIDNCGLCVLGLTGQLPCIFDCAGIWGGDAVVDECGECDGDNTSCADCEGTPNGDAIDLGCGCGDPGPSGCDNACGSTAEEDECGECDGDNTSCADCEGTPNGDAIDLGCGCGNPSPSGCDNACGSTAEEDECGVCSGDNTSCADCEGTPNGDTIDLGCGCGDPGPSGCDNACDSTAVEDECGVCDSNSNNDCVQDCAGFWGGNLVEDECGVCDGSGIPESDCDCFGNVMDECGLCGGEGAVFGDSNCCENEVDACGVCNGPGEIYECGCYSIPDLTTEENNAGYLGYCNCPESFDENNDPEWGNVIPVLADCAGVCGGSAVEDDCDACLLPLCNVGDFQGDWTFNPCDVGEAPQNSEWNTNCIDCNEIFNGPTQYDCAGVCGGSAVYDCRYNNSDFLQGNCSGDDGCGEIETEAGCTAESNELECIWMEVDYCDGSFLDTGEIYECYGYSNTGQWIQKTGDEFDTDEKCIADADEDGNPDYFWVNTGLDECGVCDGLGPIYTKDEEGDVIEGGECCEADLDECGECGAEIGETGPGLANSGECSGDAGCDVYTHNKDGCEDEDDDLTCYWGSWCDCSGTVIKDCRNNCPEDATGDEPYIGDQGTFGYDACGVCDGEGAIYQCGCIDIPEGDCDCDGNGIPDGACDCNGSVFDCAGVCGGSESLVGTGDFECIGGDYNNQTECEDGGNLWLQIGNDCSGECDGTDFSCLECDDTDGDCVGDSYGNLCLSEQIDVCGLCYGAGVSEGTCDCFGNITNCAGECKTLYIEETDEWVINEDYEEITGADIDGDGICDDVDDCPSAGEIYLIFNADGSIVEEVYPAVCLDVCIGNDGSGAVKPICELNGGMWYELNEEISEDECNENYGDWSPSSPNPFYGGFDICGVCNGDGFSCGFEAEGGLNKIQLSWGQPFSIEGFEYERNGRSQDNTGGRSETTRSTHDNFPISVNIANVDLEAGTLDIMMSNIPACSYCDPIHDGVYLVNNNNFDWKVQRDACEGIFVNSTWIVDTGMTQAECAAVPSQTDLGGWWFDGSVKGFQFELFGMTLTGVWGGLLADEYLDYLDYNADTGRILGASFGSGAIPIGEGLLTQVSFSDFIMEDGICFGTDPDNNVFSDTSGDKVLADWGPCFCSLDNLADECGECGGLGVIQECGCGEEGELEIIEDACDCTGRFPNNKYDSVTAMVAGDSELANQYICWDEEEVCDFSECTPDPNVISYNVYRQDIIGNYYQIASNLSHPHYTDANLGYEEEHYYAISYYRDANQNGQFELVDEEFTDIIQNGVWDFVDTNDNNICDVSSECEPYIDSNGDMVWTPMEEFHKPINPNDSESEDEEPIEATATTLALLQGCTYPTACGFNASANYDDGSCWWPSYMCECDDTAGAMADNCGTCDTDETNDCTADCYGAWGGSAVVDECGICGGDNSTCVDCSGTTNGVAELDDCGVCEGDNTSCSSSSWTTFTAEVVDSSNQIKLSWDPPIGVVLGRNSGGGRSSSHCNSPVCLSIEDVNTDEGTLDIYMINQAGCSYCTDSEYVNKTGCENYGSEGATWEFSTEIDSATCVAWDQNNEEGIHGVYFDGEVKGFQFELFGMTLAGISGGLAEEYLDFVNYNPATSVILGTSFGSSIIPVGEGLLTQVSFSDYTGDGICFGTDPANNVLSDASGVKIWTDWGDCYCSETSPLDACGVCGGDNSCTDECGVPSGPGPQVTCWNNSMACEIDDCPLNPDAVTYKIYRNGLGIPIYVTQDTVYTDSLLNYSNQYCYTITNVSGGVESFHSNQACAKIGEMPIIKGCMSSYACNYLEPGVECGINDLGDCPTVEDGSCWFSNTGCECDANGDGQIDSSDNSEDKGATADNCGVCDNNPDNDCDKDCAGEWYGTAVEDYCGICGGDNSSCTDCSGTPNGDAVVDNCEDCVGGDTGLTACTPDCNGDWGGTAEFDECGICAGGETEFDISTFIDQDTLIFTGAYDCNGACFGDAEIDNCGICAGGTTGFYISTFIDQDTLIFTGAYDCNGTCLGYAEFDECGICAGGETEFYISTFIDQDTLIFTGAYDCSGECFGEQVLLSGASCCIDDDDNGQCDELTLYFGLIPDEFSIHNIYPNPFNPVANIEFGLPENAYVRIMVYDINGRYIASLMDSFQFAGYYSINWNASEYSSGVYLIEMITGTFRETRQVVLMK